MAATLPAADVRTDGWYRFAGRVERFWTNGHWTDHYRLALKDTSVPEQRPEPEQEIVPDPEPDPEPEPEERPETDVAPLGADEVCALGAPSPAPRAHTDERLGADLGAPDERSTSAHPERSPSAPPERSKRTWALRRERTPERALPSAPEPTTPLGASMSASTAGEYVKAALIEMGYDPDRVTSVHVSRTPAGLLEAVVTVVEGAFPNDLGYLAQRTDIVHLSS